MDSTPEIQGPESAIDPRWVTLKPSKAALAITIVLAVGAFAVIALAPMPFAIRALFVVLWTVASMLEYRTNRLQNAGAVLAFFLRERDDVTGRRELGIDLKIRGTGNELMAQYPVTEAVVLRGGVVAPWFTAIKYRFPGDPAWRRFWPRVLPLWPDSLDAETFRRVRVALRWK